MTNPIQNIETPKIGINLPVTLTIQEIDNIISSRTVQLFELKNGSCSGANIPANDAIANPSESSTFNPEWYYLTPDSFYVAVITYTIPSGCDLDFSCLDYYATPPAPDANCTSFINQTFDAGNEGWSNSVGSNCDEDGTTEIV